MIKLMSAGVVLAAVLGASGCAAEAKAEPELPPPPPGASRPFDLFLRNEFNLIEKADLALLHRCLAEAGYPQQQVPRSGELFARLAEKPLKPRTEAEGRKNGFGATIPAQPAQILRSDPAFLAAAERCERAAQETLGDPRVRDGYVNLGNHLGRELGIRVKTVLQEESGVLLPCLAANGFPLPKGATYDPQKNVTQFGIKIGTHAELPRQPVRTLPGGARLRPGVPARPYLPTAQESRFAVAFARCGNTTGLFNRVDARLAGLQREIVEKHTAEFAELNPKIQAMAEKAAAVLRR